MSRSRVRTMKGLALVAFMVLNMFLFFFLFSQAGGRPPWHDAYKVTVVLPEALNTVDNSDVRLGGVKVGRVVDISSQGSLAEVTFEIEDDYVPMYNNGTVTPRIKTLVGETYLEIDPGDPSSGEIPDGGDVKMSQAQEIVPLERLLSTVDEKTREDIRANLRSLGSGLEDHGDNLNELFAQTTPLVANGGALVQVLRDQREELAGTVANTAEVMQAFADRTEQVRTLAVQAKVTAEAAASRDEQLRQIFAELPPTLDQANESLGILGDFSGTATPVVSDLREALVALAPTLVDLEPTAFDARKLFDELPTFIERINPLIATLEPLSDQLNPAVGSLEALLREANPALAFLSGYSADIGSFFATTGSINDVRDALGNLGRVHGILGPTSFDDLSGGGEYYDVLNTLFDLAGGPVQNQNAYPMPGTIGESSTESNFQVIESLPK